jgi:hypothetical protein
VGYPGDDKYLALAVAVSVSSVKIKEQSVSIEQSIKKYWFAVTRPTHQNRPSPFFFVIIVKIFLI